MRRWAKRLGMALLVALGTVFLVASGAWLYLSTGPGEDWLLREVEGRVDEAIAGSVRVGGLELLAATVTVTDVRLFDPEGKPVAQVERARVVVAPLALLRRTIQIDKAIIVRPELSIVRDERGSNLERALAPTREQPEPRKTEGGEPLNLRINGISVEGGKLLLRTDGNERELALTTLDATGSFENGERFIDAELEARGQVDEPAHGPLALKVRAHRDDGEWSGSVRFEAAGALVVAEGASHGPRTRVQLSELVLPPDVTQAVFSWWPLVAEVRGQARLVREDRQVQVEVALDAASANVTLQGEFDLEAWTSRGVRLEIRDVNLAELVRDGPRSDIDLQARASGGGRSLETMQGEVLVTAPASPVMGAQFGPIRVDARADEGTISLRALKLAVPGLSLNAKGEATPERVELAGTAVARNLGLFARTLGRFAGPKGLQLDGQGRASFRLQGPTRNPTLSVEANFPVLEWQGQVSRGVDVDLEVPDVGIRLRQLREPAPNVEPSAGTPRSRVVPAVARRGFTVVPAQEGRPPRPIKLRVQVEDLGFEELLKRVGLEIALDGVTEAKVQLSGTPEDPGLDLRVRLNRVMAEGLPPLDVTVTARSRPGEPITLGLATTADEQSNRLTVRLPWSLGALFRRRPTAEDALGASYVVTGELGGLPVPPALLGLKGNPILSGTIDVQGTPRSPRGRAELIVSGIGGGSLPPLALGLDLRLQGDTTRALVNVTQGEHLIARLDSTVAAGPLRLRTVLEDPDLPIEGELLVGPVSFADLTTFATWLRPDAEVRLPAGGLVSGHVSFKGSLAKPEVDADVALFGLAATEQARPGDLLVRGGYQNGRLALSARVVGPTAGSMEFAVSAPIELSLQRLRAGIDLETLAFEGSVRATGMDPAFLSGLTPQLLHLGGRIYADARIAGSVSQPNLQGEVRWEDGEVDVAGYGSYREIQLVARGDRDRVIVETLTASSGGGTAAVTGALQRSGGEGYALDARIGLDRFPIVNQDQLVAHVTLAATAKGLVTLDRVVISPLDISRARVVLPTLVQKNLQSLEPPKNVEFVLNGQPVSPAGQKGAPATPEKGKRRERRLTFEVEISAPQSLLVIGPDFNVELGLIEGFRVQVEDEPVLSGTVRIIRGVLEVYGREFRLEADSTVRFSGSPRKPDLDVTALHVNASEDVTITLAIRGVPPELEITPSSDPPMSETEIYTLLATGRRLTEPGPASGGIGASAVSLLGGVITGRLEQGISEFVPVDYLRIQPGAEGFTGTRIETGSQLTDRLFLGLETQIGAEVPWGQNRSQIEIDYQFSRRIVLELIYGDARVGSLELLWRRRY